MYMRRDFFLLAVLIFCRLLTMNKTMLRAFLSFALCGLFVCCSGTSLLVPMDQTQTNHLKAYGMAYWVLARGQRVDWLLNYQGGSFVFPYSDEAEKEMIIRGVHYVYLSQGAMYQLYETLSMPTSNTEVVKLEKTPKIAVYSPKTKQPWDDAVTLVLTYSAIPYDVVFDDEVLYGELGKYDWLHLHHEDFTGQYGKFYASYHTTEWYQRQQQEYEKSAAKHGFSKVSQLKLAVAKKMKAYVLDGGFLFAMCSATDTYDISLAAEAVDVCESMYDGDEADPLAQRKLDFSKTFAFEHFLLEKNPYVYEYANIDMQLHERGVREGNDYFTLAQFSAKWDPIPTMLTQNHQYVIKGFMGQTTAFRKAVVKANVVVMGENKTIGEARYIHGIHGDGFWTFYGGHDPEDYQHMVGEPSTDLNLHPSSPGYRLILNNVLFPAAEKKKMKT